MGLSRAGEGRRVPTADGLVEAGAVVVTLGAHSAQLTSRFGYSPPMVGEASGRKTEILCRGISGTLRHGKGQRLPSVRDGILFRTAKGSKAKTSGRQGTRAALYLRVPTAEQKPDLQQDALRAYAGHAGLELLQSYCDVAFSGRKEGWRQLNALMATARRREIDCVLVWKFDHLGVRFVSVQDQVDTNSPMGRAMFTIIGAVAELESLLISERVTAGMRAAEARSRPLGRPGTPQYIVSDAW